ncbi:MAG: hypothetical protein DRP50_03085 [Thermotoga sp.]|nr:MAG: hypothetical protein DRP50_03085 [Thermotoga sp.]
MPEEIDKEKIKTIHLLREQGKNKNEVAEILGLSWATIDKYWDQWEKKEGQEEIKKAPSGEDYKKLYTLFEEGKGIVESVIETGLSAPIVNLVFSQYCKDKHLSSLKEVEENLVASLLKRIEACEKEVEALRDNFADNSVKIFRKTIEEEMQDIIQNVIQKIEEEELKKYDYRRRGI